MRIFSNILDQAERQAEINTHGDAGRRRAAEQGILRRLPSGCRARFLLPSAVNCCVVLVVCSQTWSMCRMCVVIGKQDSVLSVFMFHYRPQCHIKS